MSVTLIGLYILHGSIWSQQLEDAHQGLISEAMLRLRNAAAILLEAGMRGIKAFSLHTNSCK